MQREQDSISKLLDESFGVYVIDHADNALINMVHEWSWTKCPELSVVLSLLKHAAYTHQTHHWQSRGEQFYGDHLLFERIYSAIAKQIDSIAERAIGISGSGAVNLAMQTSQVARLITEQGELGASLAERSLFVEISVLDRLKKLCEMMNAGNRLSIGTDNLLAQICDEHEEIIYLLRQRMSKE